MNQHSRKGRTARQAVDRLRTLKAMTGMTLQEMSVELEREQFIVSPSTLHKWLAETREPKGSCLLSLCVALDSVRERREGKEIIYQPDSLHEKLRRVTRKYTGVDFSNRGENG